MRGVIIKMEFNKMQPYDIKRKKEWRRRHQVSKELRKIPFFRKVLSFTQGFWTDSPPPPLLSPSDKKYGAGSEEENGRNGRHAVREPQRAGQWLGKGVVCIR